jgi:hypothetical protein
MVKKISAVYGNDYYKYYVSGHYPLSRFYLKHDVSETEFYVSK